MKKLDERILLLAAACTLSLETGFAQQTQASPVLKSWALTYGSSSPYEGVFDLGLNPHGDITVAGTTSAFGVASGAGWLLHVDPIDGEVVTEGIVINNLGGVTDGAGLAADGGALFSGRLVLDLFTKHDAWLVRVDDQGQPQWWRGFTSTGFGRHFLFDSVELDSGAWVAVGAKSVIDQPPQSGWVVRLSAGGDTEWQYEYGAGIADHLQSVAPTADGGVVVAGWTNSSGAGFDDAWVMKLDAAGAIQWQHTYGGHDSDHATSVTQLASGGFAVAGHTRSYTASGYAPWVLRLSGRGNLVWHRIADGVWGDLQSIAETSGDGVVAHGRVGETGFPSNDLWAVELGPTGDVRWQRAYEGSSGDWGSAVLALPASRFVLGGIWGWGFPEEDLFVVRTAQNGRLPGCSLDRPTSFPMISPAPLVQPGTATRQVPGVIDRPFEFSFGDTQAIETRRCH